MSVLSHHRARRQRTYLLDQKHFYEKEWLPDEIEKWQLYQFNIQWQAIRRDAPYFRRLSEQNRLPARFSTWQEFQQIMPVMDRRVIQDNREALANSTNAPDFWRTTGGSTAEPLQIPVWNSEIEFATKDIWTGRSWFGVEPSDRLFLIWGHSHLLGTGARGWFNGAKRRLKDHMLGYYRYSAYDLSERQLQQAAEALLEFRSAYLIAYAVALDRFARINQSRRAAFHRLDLKVAIATAESFPRADSAAVVADVLGCPVAMEYGAVETGPIAHQRPNGDYSVFWRHYFVEGCESTHVPGAYEILVTSLYPRCLPLVRYKLGDLILAESSEQFTRGFEAVIGRCNDYVMLQNGGVIHSEAFTHVVKDMPAVLAYQVIQSADGIITLRYIAANPLESREVDEIRRRLHRVNPYLSSIRIDRVELLRQTIAGKTRRIIREPPRSLRTQR